MDRYRSIRLFVAIVTKKWQETVASKMKMRSFVYSSDNKLRIN